MSNGFDAYLAESPTVGESMQTYSYTFTQPVSTPDGQVVDVLPGIYNVALLIDGKVVFER